MKFNAAILIIALAAAGCGKKVNQSSQETAKASASAQLDKGQYESAISTLEPIHAKHPHDEEIKTKLLHAYAGAGGFEALKVMSTWKEIEVLLKKFKKVQEDEIKGSAKAGLDQFATELEKLLAPIPELTTKQQKRLNQAIELYQELGLRVETAGRYNNFKWGTLHVYRLAFNLKTMVKELRKAQVGAETMDLGALEAVALPKLKVIGQDIFMAYKLYGNSFDKIKKIIDSVDKIIAKTVNNKEFRLKVNTMARNEAEFYRSLIEDNIASASVLFRKLGEIYVNNGYEERFQKLSEGLPSTEEIAQTNRRIETLVRVFLKNFTEENPQVEERLKNIFTEDLKKEVMTALRSSIELKNSNPIKELLASKKPEIATLSSYYLLLTDAIKVSDLEEEIKVELEALKGKVDLELMKEEARAITLALKEDTLVVQLGAEAVVYRSEEQLVERNKLLEKEIKWLEKFLGDLSQELRLSLEQDNPDKEKMEKIVEETKAFVEY